MYDVLELSVLHAQGDAADLRSAQYQGDMDSFPQLTPVLVTCCISAQAQRLPLQASAAASTLGSTKGIGTHFAFLRAVCHKWCTETRDAR